MSDRKAMLVFPGQGSQYLGMGSDIHSEFEAAKEVYQEASDVLGYDVQALSFNDPNDQIGLTRYTQPVLLTHSIACLRSYEALSGNPIPAAMGAGHSLGEYTALVAAGILTLEDGLKLVSRRGELMGEHGEGGMAALNLDAETAQEIADKHYCQVATCNLPEQTVVGGSDSDLQNLVAYMKANYPRKRAIPLATEGAFHTYLMVTAAREFRSVLDNTPFASDSPVQVLSNYTATMHDQDADSIRTRLFFQLFKPVDWVGCLRAAMGKGINTFIEFGGGLGKGDGPAAKRPNLESIIKKTLKLSGHEAEYVAAINLDTIRNATQTLSS